MEIQCQICDRPAEWKVPVDWGRGFIELCQRCLSTVHPYCETKIKDLESIAEEGLITNRERAKQFLVSFARRWKTRTSPQLAKLEISNLADEFNRVAEQTKKRQG